MENRKKIYVAGDHIISALGFSTTENMEAVLRNESGIRQVNDPGLYHAEFPAACIDRKRLSEKIKAEGLEEYSCLEQLFILSIGEVLRQTGLDLHDNSCGLVIATTKGNVDRIDGEEAYLWKMAQRVSRYFHCARHPVVVSNACISGVSALIAASRWIECGEYEHMVVTGGDWLTRFVVTGFQSFKSVSSLPCRPYDAQRDGLTLGEACGAVALTADRSKVKVFPAIVLEGGAITNDANHISGPSRTGDGLYYAVRAAMQEAGVFAGEISFVNAHGTATPYNDEMEAKAFHWAGLGTTPLNSLKGYWGHTLGAAGVIESIACFEQLRRGIVCGTKGFETSGVSLPLGLSGSHLPMAALRCVKTASGFGGCNAAAIFALEEQSGELRKEQEYEVGEVRQCRIGQGQLFVDGELKIGAEDSFGDFIRMAFKAQGQSSLKFYKMDDLCKLGYVAAGWLLDGIEIEGQATGIILANAASSLVTDRKHQDIIDRLGDAEASPAVFVYTLPNVVMGEICIRHKIQGENTFFIMECKSMEFLKDYAVLLMKKNKLKACIYGWCELDGENYEADFRLLCQKKDIQN